MIKRAIFHLAPHERFNFGDILYSDTLRNILEEMEIQDDFYYVGFKNVDTSKFGAGNVITIDKMIEISKSYDKCVLFIGGGECVGASYNDLLSHIGDSDIDVSNYFKVPYVADNKLDGTNIEVVYISVGGYNDNKKVGEDFNRTNFPVYVRDEYTKKSLDNIGVENVVALPDLATLCSRYYNENSSFVELPCNPFIVFQVGKYKYSDLEVIAKELVRISNFYDVVLLPLGICEDHDDHLILQELYDMIGDSDKIHYIMPENIYDIMRVIKYSDCVIGTSLHLMIVSYAFGNNWITMNNIYKANRYQESWYKKFYNNVHESKIGKLLSVMSPVDKSNSVSYQQSLLLEHFNTLVNNLK